MGGSDWNAGRYAARYARKHKTGRTAQIYGSLYSNTGKIRTIERRQCRAARTGLHNRGGNRRDAVVAIQRGHIHTAGNPPKTSRQSLVTLTDGIF